MGIGDLGKWYKNVSRYLISMDPELSKQKYREYQRDYQRRRYQENKVKGRAYQTSMRMKRGLDLSKELWETYKHHLADALKLVAIMERIPIELIHKIVANYPQLVEELKDEQKKEEFTDV